MVEIGGLFGLQSGKPTTAVLSIPAITAFGPNGGTPDAGYQLFDRLDPAISYKGGVVLPQAGDLFPKNLFVTTTNLTLNDGSRIAIGGRMVFSTDASQFQVRLYINQRIADILVDGKRAESDPLTYSAGNLQWLTVDLSASGLTAGFHTITIEATGGGAFGGIALPTGTSLRAADNSAPRMVFLGDSFTEGAGATAGAGYAPTTAMMLGVTDIWDSGFGGTGYDKAFNNRPNLADRIVIDGVNAKGDIYVVAMGVNDDATSPTFHDNMVKTLTTLSQGAPNAKIFVVSAWNSRQPGLDVRTLVNADIQTTAATLPNVVYLDASDVPFTKADTTHPDNAGHLVLAQWLTSHIRDSMGADGVVDQNVAGDMVGPITIKGYDAAAHYTFTVQENGAVSTRFEVVDTGDSFPILRLKDGVAIADTGTLNVNVVIDDGTGQVNQTVTFAVRQHLSGSVGDDVLVGSKSLIRN